jgi:GNAT superfamily N-acetyltransferase
VTQNISCEVGRREDLLPFLDLLEEAESWLSARGISQWQPGSHRRQLSRLDRFLGPGSLLVARQGERLAGGCLVTPTPYDAWRGHPGSAAYLEKLVVARFAAGRSLGTRLMSFAELWSRDQGMGLLRLDCIDESENMRRYYRGLGFRELEVTTKGAQRVRLFEKPLAG